MTETKTFTEWLTWAAKSIKYWLTRNYYRVFKKHKIVSLTFEYVFPLGHVNIDMIGNKLKYLGKNVWVNDGKLDLFINTLYTKDQKDIFARFYEKYMNNDTQTKTETPK